MNEKHKKTAVTVFITDLPNAMVILQELENSNIRDHFANSFLTFQRKYNEQDSGGNGQTHLNHKPRQKTIGLTTRGTIII